MFGNEFDSSQDGSDGCRAFFSQVQVREKPIDLPGHDLFFVEASSDLHEYLVDVAGDLGRLINSIYPIQEVDYGMAIDTLGIKSNGLKLKRLRRLGNGLFGGDAQSVVHVESSLFCSGCQVVRLFVNIRNTLQNGTGNVFVPEKGGICNKSIFQLEF